MHFLFVYEENYSHAEYVKRNFHLLEIVVQMLVLLGQYLVAYKVQLADNLRLCLRLVLPGGLKSKLNDKR